jgi:hypothetical protein
MVKERRFILSRAGKALGTYSETELRQLILSGRVVRSSECSEVATGSWPGEAIAAVPIISMPEFADLKLYYIEEDSGELAEARVMVTNRLLLYFGTWAVVLLLMGLVALYAKQPLALPMFVVFFPTGLTLWVGRFGLYFFWLGYVFYPVHAVITFYCRKPRFAVMYSILILALVLNVIGCITTGKHSLPDVLRDRSTFSSQ